MGHFSQLNLLGSIKYTHVKVNIVVTVVCNFYFYSFFNTKTSMKLSINLELQPKFYV